MEGYKRGGYHPVHVGEVLLNRYIILQKLGWGHFSTAWLAKDKKYETFVAIKIQKASQQCLEAAYEEVEILQELEKHNFDPEWVESVKDYWKNNPKIIKRGVQRDHSQIVQLLNSFFHCGPNGKHFCMVFEIMGVSLLEIIKRYNNKGIPIPYVRLIAKQILIGLDFLHRICGIIHTDLKPENVLVCLTQKELREIYKTWSLNIPKRERCVNIQNDILNISDNINDKLTDNDNSPKITGKRKRKKNQKIRKVQAKKLEKLGLSQEEIIKEDEKLKEQKKFEAFKESAEEEINVNNYNINELIERPRSISVPKYKIDFYIDNDDDQKGKIPFDFDVNKYSNLIQKYIKERRRIFHDIEYRKNLLIKKAMLSKAKTEYEKNEILKHTQDKGKQRGPLIDENIRVKICDLGNACWYHHHFSTEILTRQYRSPEVILGINYNNTADIWSFACMIFELVTGDFLFEPIAAHKYTKNDDHLAQMIELLGRMPKKFALNGAKSRKFFSKEGNLLRINKLRYWPLKSVLMDKYKIKENEAGALADFLSPMLEYYPEKRASARKMLQHYWLNMHPNYDYYMNEWECEKMAFFKKKEQSEKEDLGGGTKESDEENNLADDEDNEQYNLEDYYDESFYINKNVNSKANGKEGSNYYMIDGHLELNILDRANTQFDMLI